LEEKFKLRHYPELYTQDHCPVLTLTPFPNHFRKSGPDWYFLGQHDILHGQETCQQQAQPLP